MTERNKRVSSNGHSFSQRTMTDTRALSTSSPANANPTASTLPADLNNVNNLTSYVNTIFHQMEEKFLAASDQMMSRMNELGKKIDCLESNLGEIISTLPTEESSTADSTQKKS